MVKHFKGEGCGVVALAESFLLFADLLEDARAIGKMLEEVNQAAAHGILRRKEEGEEDHGHFSIGEVLAPFVIGGSEGGNPFLEHALWLTSFGHSDTTPGTSQFEPVHGPLTALNGIPDFGSRKGNGEVDQL